MKKEDIATIAQLLSSMKDMLVKLESANKNRDMARLESIKREILNLQKEIDKLL